MEVQHPLERTQHFGLRRGLSTASYGLIREKAAGSARDIALAVVDAVGAFRGSEAEDDLTCLVVKVR
jgi:hypothetical protein